jgi:hypothetical protein
MEGKGTVRDAVISHLELLGSLELQAKYERDVKVADVPAELVCGWFDDLDLPASASKLFVGDDLESVRAFNDFFEGAMKELANLTLSELHARPLWRQVVDRARQLSLQLERSAG